VYVGSYDGKLYALDAATGDVRWTFQSPSAIHGAPTVMGGLVYFSSCGTCGRRNSRSTKQGRRGTFAVDARTGKLGWKYPDGRYSPIVADGERVYLTGHTRQHAFEPRKPRTLAQARRPRSQ
ncbi:MAG: PQQ-binding-like beta-propeller repeat protein, partial [Gaiellaceae bacterium]